MSYRAAPSETTERTQTYPSDLSTAEWALIEPLLPPRGKTRGQPRIHPLREIVNAIRYVQRTGCQWRALPHDLPPWPTVATYFYLWRNDGTWERVRQALHRQVRQAQGRDPEPSAAILDSQSVKTGQKGGLGATTPTSA